MSYNVLEEKWIPVLWKDGNIDRVGIMQGKPSGKGHKVSSAREQARALCAARGGRETQGYPSRLAQAHCDRCLSDWIEKGQPREVDHISVELYSKPVHRRENQERRSYRYLHDLNCQENAP